MGGVETHGLGGDGKELVRGYRVEHSRVSDLDNPEASTRIGKTRVIFVQAEMKLCRLFSFHFLFFNS